jgi:Ni/Fe-hydrogenase subunit HybB-like protein
MFSGQDKQILLYILLAVGIMLLIRGFMFVVTTDPNVNQQQNKINWGYKIAGIVLIVGSGYLLYKNKSQQGF